ncbi:hypothetical protein I79_001902 [Cricetulus griseus]|uniref:Uncharacterized protein n=1 Tax=Cricetulus griseus TaxID=10029 RepID=G3GVZ6_CRIGR|nr:hypothetical protein I79_001902 [Cricetulus griseus]
MVGNVLLYIYFSYWLMTKTLIGWLSRQEVTWLDRNLPLANHRGLDVCADRQEVIYSWAEPGYKQGQTGNHLLYRDT